MISAQRLLIAYGFAAAANVTGQLLDAGMLTTATKPLLMPLLLAFLLRSTTLHSRLLRLTAAGLAFAWLGDLALMPHGDGWFMVGLIGFLAAQVCYSLGFATTFGRNPIRRTPAAAIPYIGWWLLLLGVLAADLGGLLVPVAVYGAVLCTMAALALGVHRWTAVGAVLFVISDSVLAATSLSDRLTIPADGAVVMATYTAGQALIVLGVLAASRRLGSGEERIAATAHPR